MAVAVLPFRAKDRVVTAIAGRNVRARGSLGQHEQAFEIGVS